MNEEGCWVIVILIVAFLGCFYAMYDTGYEAGKEAFEKEAVKAGVAIRTVNQETGITGFQFISPKSAK